MRVIDQSRDVTILELSKDELTILSNAVNEICNGPGAIDEEQFHTRIGASRQKAEALLEALGRET
jgi:hypothetical protein